MAVKKVKRAKVKKAKKPKVKPVKKPITKKKVTKKKVTKKKTTKKKAVKKTNRPQVVRARQFKTETFILEHFRKRGKKPPVRYRRPVPKGMVKVKLVIERRKIKTGSLIEFKYGRKQKPGQVGGWKNDPRPVIFLFHDHKIKYVEGINTNYLSEYYLKKVRQIMNRFPGVEGYILYNVFKRTAKHAVKKGYRKYMRDSLKDIYLYVYEDDLERTLDAIAKSKTSDMGVADGANNAGAER